MISLHEAQRRLAPIESAAVEGTRAAASSLRELVQHTPALALPLDDTARANFLHCHVRHEVARRVEGLAGVKVSTSLRFFALAVEDDILLRFKLLVRGRPRNYPTEQQQMLDAQHYDEQMILALGEDGFLAPPTLLTAGYTITDEHEIGRIEVRRDCIGHPPWKYDIFGAHTIVDPIPFPGLEDTARPARVSSSRKLKVVRDLDADQG